MVVGGEGAGDGLAGVVVVPDGGGQGEDALGDAGGDAVDGQLPAERVQFAERVERPGWGRGGVP